MDEDRILSGLEDAGCTALEIEAVRKTLESGNDEELLHRMRCLRANLLEEMHLSQRRVDTLDTLIREVKKQ